MEAIKFLSTNFTEIVGAVVAAIAYVWLWRIAEYAWLRPRRIERLLRAQGFSGNRYRLLHGDMKDLAAVTAAAQSVTIGVGDDIAPYALPYHHHILTKYGKKSFIWNGPKPRILLMEPDLIKDVMFKYEIFGRVYTNPLNRLFVRGLISYEGKKWAKHRRILNPSFTFAKLKDMLPKMHISCNNVVENWEILLSNKESYEIDAWSTLSNLSADVISRTAFGSNYEEGQKIFLLQREQNKLVMQLSQSAYIPGSRFLPSKTKKRLQETSEELRHLLRGIIDTRVVEIRSGTGSTNDLLGMLLESNLRDVEASGGKGITTEEVIDECKLFYIAGQETTSSLLLWTMVMLSVHKEWQVRAREEVFEVFGTSKPDFEGLNQLKKMNMILNEVLRLYPPAPTILRTSLEATKLGDLTLPSGVEIIVPSLLVHHDKEIWGDDAKEFKPERFGNGVTNATNGKLAAFVPFALGPRICIGQNFALVEAKLALAMFLQRFSFELSPNYKHSPIPVLTLQPKTGAKIMLRKVN